MKYNTNQPCTACLETRENYVCLHHVKTRGSGGTDEPFNLMPLCQAHHNMIHMIGLSSMSKRFTPIHDWLTKNNWVWDNFQNKWTH
jgi:hypothetical protein